jgi:hypothetical protein
MLLCFQSISEADIHSSLLHYKKNDHMQRMSLWFDMGIMRDTLLEIRSGDVMTSWEGGG